jgi:hypothetical protein
VGPHTMNSTQRFAVMIETEACVGNWLRADTACGVDWLHVCGSHADTANDSFRARHTWRRRRRRPSSRQESEQ